MIRAILTDIEGTTSSISFVHDVLFPYARGHMKEFVHASVADPQVAALLDDVRRAAGASELDLDGVVAQLVAWIDADSKTTPLKALQGMIWEDGYRRGDLTGHVYPDAVRQLERWSGSGLRLYIFSSGSVQAQQLLFRHSDAGDLTPLFAGYFDTRIGNKQDPDAYRAIATEIDLPPEDILFLSDIRAELDAAAAVGMRTIWLVRDGQPDPDAPHHQVAGFTDIDPTAPD